MYFAPPKTWPRACLLGRKPEKQRSDLYEKAKVLEQG